MQEREAKMLFKADDLDAVYIYSAELDNGWCIAIKDKLQPAPHDLVSKRSPQPRVFKTSDAALRCCQRIGFNQVEIHIQTPHN